MLKTRCYNHGKCGGNVICGSSNNSTSDYRRIQLTFNIGFGLSGSVSVDFTSKDGSDELYISKHGADPVDIKFTAE